MPDQTRDALRDPLAVQDPLARQDPVTCQHARWQRGRALVCTAIGLAFVIAAFLYGAGAEPIVVHLEAKPKLEPTPSPSFMLMLLDEYGESRHTVEPRIELRPDTWTTRDLFGVAARAIEVGDDPTKAEAELLEWVRSICDGQPRWLYLVNPEDDDFTPLQSRLAERIWATCPSFEVVITGVEIVDWCGSVGETREAKMGKPCIGPRRRWYRP
jgi:hypothetical protein